VTAVAAGGIGMAATGGGATVELCPDAGPELAGVWDAGRATQVRAALGSLAPARAEQLLAAIEPQLERYAAGWVAMRNDACRAHAEGRQSAQLFDQRTSCLDQRRAALAATVEAFALAEPADVDALVEA